MLNLFLCQHILIEMSYKTQLLNLWFKYNQCIEKCSYNLRA